MSAALDKCIYMRGLVEYIFLVFNLIDQLFSSFWNFSTKNNIFEQQKFIEKVYICQ